MQSLGKKDELLKTIVAIPVIIDYKSKNDSDAVIKYLRDVKGLKEPKLLIGKIKTKTLLEVNGTPVWIAGVQPGSLLVHNAVQLILILQIPIFALFTLPSAVLSSAA